MKKAIVILPTYNGEVYLKELLDSIYNQTYPLIEIYTRDDGSSDKTLDIIKEYSKIKQKGRKMTIIPNGGKAWKCPDCFIKLLELAKDGDYYFYCDQDDYWYPEKIEEAINKMEKEDSNTPTAHFGAYYFCDSDLNIIKKSPRLPNKVRLRNVIYDYFPLGFNISFNKSLYNVIFKYKPKYIYYHDCWVIQVALGIGNFIYDDKPSVKYRRQAGAVTYSNHSKLSLLKWRIERFLSGGTDNLIRLRKILEEYKDIFKSKLSEEDKQMLDIFTNKGFKNYVKRVFYPHRLRLKLTEEIGLRILLLFGKL